MIVLFYEIRELGIHTGAAHIRRIGHNYIVLSLHRLCNVDEGH